MTLQVIWSLEALGEFELVYEYWGKRNRSNHFSNKLWKLTSQSIDIIRNEPKLGIQTNQTNIRMRLISKNYYLIYKIEKEHLEILKFWDVRQNPIKNKFNQKY